MRRAVVAALAFAAALAAARADDVPLPPGVDELKDELVLTEHLYEGSFRSPVGLWCDHRSGETYLVDRSTNLVSIFDASGVPLFAFGDARLREPRDLAVDGQDRIWVLDNDASAVKVYSYRGEFLSHFRAPASKKPHAFTAIAFDRDGNLYLGDSANREVLVLDADRRVVMRLRSGVGPDFSQITGIAFDAKYIYVGDQDGVAIQVFDHVGRFIQGWGVHETGKDNVSLPHGIAVDAAGRIVLIDTLRQEVKLYFATSQLVGIFGGLGYWVGAVRYPTDVCVDAAGRIWVADTGNARLQVFSVVESQPPPDVSRRARR